MKTYITLHWFRINYPDGTYNMAYDETIVYAKDRADCMDAMEKMMYFKDEEWNDWTEELGVYKRTRKKGLKGVDEWIIISSGQSGGAT